MKYFDFEKDSIQDIIEASNSIYNAISIENYRGVDAIIEVVINEEPINLLFGIHILKSHEFKEIDSIYSIDVSDLREYLDVFHLPIILVLIEEFGEGYWEPYIPKSKNIQIFKIPENVFNFQNFNLVIIDYLLNKKKSYFNIEENLGKQEYEFLFSFCKTIFNLPQLSVPFIMANEYFDEFLEVLNLNIEYSDEIIPLSYKENLNQFIVHGKYLWYYTHASNNQFVISVNLVIELARQYVEIRK